MSPNDRVLGPRAAVMLPWMVLPWLIVPWLNPFTSGPNASVQPLLLSWACFAMVLLGWAWIPQTPQQRMRTVASAWLMAAGISAALGLLQYFDLSEPLAPWVNQPGVGEAYGNLRQRNQFATLCNMGLAALAWWVEQAEVFSRGHRAGVLLSACLAALLAAAVAASGSRTGLLQMGVLAVLGLVWSPTERGVRKGAHWSVLGIAMVLVAYVLAAVLLPLAAGVPHGALERWPESSAQCNSRLNLWRNVMYLIAQKPLWGWGWGELGYAHFMTLYDAPWSGLRFCQLLDNAHNLPLHLAVELGLPAALFLCAMVVIWVWRQRPLREKSSERKLAWAVLAVIGVHSLLEYPLWYGQFQAATLLCLWMLRAFAQPGDSADKAPAGVTSWGWPSLVGALLIGLACAGMGWSYWRVSQPYLPPELRAPQFRDQSWSQLRQVWIFSDQVDFAQLAVTPVVPANAAAMQSLATDLLHFSPEPMVVEKLLQSAQIQGKGADVAFYAKRFEAAYPLDYANWVKTVSNHYFSYINQ